MFYQLIVRNYLGLGANLRGQRGPIRGARERLSYKDLATPRPGCGGRERGRVR